MIALDDISAEGQGGAAQSVAGQGFAPNTTVTGMKTDTQIREVPSIVNVITREEMDKRGVEDFNQALAYTPAVRVRDYPGGQGSPTIYIRGFQTINQEGVYQDGLRAGFNSFDKTIDTFPFERIDILKGPASVLYGRAEPGGIVSLITKRPTAVPFGEIELQGGSFDRKQGTIDLGGPIDADGKFLYRVSGLIRDSDTQVDFTPNDRRYIAPAFTWKPDEDTSLTILGSYGWSKAGGSEQSLPVIGTIRRNQNGRVARDLFLGEPGFNKEELENGQIGAIFDRNLSDQVSFHSTTRGEWTKSDYKTMGSLGTGKLYDAVTPGDCSVLRLDDGIAGNERCYLRGSQARQQRSSAFLTDNNFVFKADTGPFSHKLLVGVDYWDYHRDEKRQNGPNSGIDVFDPDYGNSPTGPLNPFFNTDAKLKQLGLYVQDQIKFDKWILTLGGRHDWAKVDQVVQIKAFSSPDVLTKTDNKKFSWRTGLGYEFDNGFVPYVSYTTGFNPQPISDASGNAFRPSESEQYEAGLKFQPDGYDGYAAASVFQIKKTNAPTADPDNVGFSIAVGEVRVRGFEFENKVKLVNGLDLLAAYTYLDTEVTKDNGGLQGNRMPDVPKHQASLWLDYAMQPASGLDGLRFGAGVRYMGATRNSTNTLRVADYTLFDASASYDLGKANEKLKGFKVSIEAKNLADKRYFTPGIYATGDTVFAGYRRQVLASVSYRW